MNREISNSAPLRYYKKVLAFIKKVSIESFKFNKHNKQIYSESPASTLKKIISKHTWPIIKYFILITIIACITTIAATYYVQKKIFEQQLYTKSNLVELKLTKIIQNYQNSLTSISQLLLKNKKYLDQQKVMHLLKLAYISDRNLKLLPLTWHSLLEPKSLNFQKISRTKLNTEFIKSIKQDPKTFTVYDKITSSGEVTLVIIYKVIDNFNANQTNKKSQSNLIGFFELPIRLSTIVQDFVDDFAEGDILKISKGEESLYFIKQNDSLRITQDLDLTQYNFANEISFASYPYKVTIGSKTNIYIHQWKEISIILVSIIVCLATIFIVVYNLIERLRLKDAYNQSFSAELLVNKKQIDDLVKQINLSNLEIQSLTQQNQSYHDSIKAITSIEKQIHDNYLAILTKIRDSNQLLVKSYSKQKELKPEVIEALFATINSLSEDLLQNVFSRETRNMSEIKLSRIISKVLDLFKPMIIKRDIKIINEVERIKLKTNELLFTQILISLFAKALYSLPKGHKLTIKAKVDATNTKVMLEISNDGIDINDDLLVNILFQKKQDLVPGLTYIQLKFETIKELTDEILGGDLKLSHTDHDNSISLLLPLEQERTDNVIPFARIVENDL